MSKDEVIEIWLDAEEELRNENEDKGVELKEKFTEEFSKLSKSDQEDVKAEAENLAL